MRIGIGPSDMVSSDISNHTVDLNFFRYQLSLLIPVHKGGAGSFGIVGVSVVCYDTIRFVFKVDLEIFLSINKPLSNIGIPAAALCNRRSHCTLFNESFR